MNQLPHVDRILMAVGSCVLGLVLGLLMGAAIAQTVFTGSPYIPLPTGVENYQKVAAVTTGSASFNKYQSRMDLTNASGIATYTLNLYPTPPDGQVSCMFSIGGVTTLTLSAPTPTAPAGTAATINNGISAMTALTNYCFVYSSANNSWDRIQ